MVSGSSVGLVIAVELESSRSFFHNPQTSDVCCCFSHEHIEIVVTKDGEPVFFRQREGPFFPSLRLLHRCKMLFVHI